MLTNTKSATKGIRTTDWFVLSAGLVFSLTGLAKIISAFGHSKILVTLDPIVGIRFKYLLIIVGSAEVAISYVCLFTQKSKLAMALTAWLTALIFGYRIGLLWIGWKIPCQCMGSLADALRLPANIADNILKGMLAYLLIGSWFIVLKGLRDRN